MVTVELASSSGLEGKALAAAIRGALSTAGARLFRCGIRKALERDGKSVSDWRLAQALASLVQAGIVINLTKGAARGYELAEWERLARAKEGSKSCEADILATLADVGMPLNAMAIFIALRERRREWPAAEVSTVLNRLVKAGTLVFIPGGGRYCLKAKVI